LSGSDRDALDDVATDLGAAAVEEPGGADVGVAGENLYVLDGDPAKPSGSHEVSLGEVALTSL